MKRTIGIVGGGFSGCLVAYHLLCNSPNLKLIIFNKTAQIGPGIAYQPVDDVLLLNVRAGKMSALPDQPNHFLDWLIQQSQFKKIKREILADSFVSRTYYGQYLSHIWSSLLQQYPKSIQVVAEEVSAIAHAKEVFTITAKDKTFKTNYCVLATGNEQPKNLTLRNEEAYTNKHYFQNPWMINPSLISNDKPILIIGTGLTMVDTVQLLRKNNKKGAIHCISPHGFNILPHSNEIGNYKGILTNVNLSERLAGLLTQFNQARKELKKNGETVESLVNFLRPKTGSLWQSFTTDEKSFFLRHLRHKWGVARHRVPLSSYQEISKELDENRLIIKAGKIKEIKASKDGFTLTYFDAHLNNEVTLSISSIINCTGPASDVTKMTDGLLANLFHNEFIEPDPLFLGIRASVNNFTVINNRNIKRFYALGTLLKGELWESTAVNELREQAKQLALTIQKELKNE